MSNQYCLSNSAKISGSSLIEFSLAAIPILLVGLGGIEVARWFYIKQAVSLALLQAARAGITEHANPKAIESAFEHGLLHLYPATDAQSAEQRMQTKFNQRSAATGLPPWKIEIIGPPPQAFQDFPYTESLKGRQTGLSAINNSYQTEQDERYRAKGWVNGLGPHSGLSIYQANTLILRATYLHEPLLPGMKGLVRTLSARTDSYASQGMAHGGYLPITQMAALAMQSDPLDWPSPSSQKVVRAETGPVAHTPYAALACQGIWCLGSSRSLSPGVETDTAIQALDDQAVYTDPATNQGLDTPTKPGDAGSSDLSVAPNDPACGVTLCCVGA